MADATASPLSDEERDELEALRAEKARRAEEERARVERAELEALRAEQAQVDAEILAERAAQQRALEQRAARPAQAEGHGAPGREAAAAAEPQEVGDAGHKTFGQRMVTSGSVDDDGIPTMPAAQKIIIAIALIAVVAFAIYTAVR